MPYFERLDDLTFAPSRHVGGAWNTEEQHVAPALGLLTHLVEEHRDRRRHDRLVVARLSFDILGTMAMETFSVAVRVARPGRTIELVEATLTQRERPAVVLRAWLMQQADTAAITASDLGRLPPPEQLTPWDPATVWPGGFIDSVEIRRWQTHPGHAVFWARARVPLLREPVSTTATVAGLLDVANGMTVRAAPASVMFPNVDLTAHLFREPAPGWLGFQTQVSFGPTGHGLTSSTVHDQVGPLGVVAQALTLRLAEQ